MAWYESKKTHSIPEEILQHDASPGGGRGFEKESLAYLVGEGQRLHKPSFRGGINLELWQLGSGKDAFSNRGHKKSEKSF